jgi:hypothetical protein
VRSEDYIEHRFGHDLGFPYKMVQKGRRAVFEPQAQAFEKPSAEQEDEYRRKVRMFEWCWLTVFEGGMFRRLTPVYWVELISHRLLRYASGLLHLVLLGASVVLVGLRAGDRLRRNPGGPGRVPGAGAPRSVADPHPRRLARVLLRPS